MMMMKNNNSSSGFFQLTGKALEAREFAKQKHEAAGKLYAGKPYTVHLDMVAYFATSFYYCIKPLNHTQVPALPVQEIAYLHDVPEDCYTKDPDKGLAEITELFGPVVGKTVDLLTNRGKRNNPEYLKGINSEQLAIFCKLTDRIANLWYGLYGTYEMLPFAGATPNQVLTYRKQKLCMYIREHFTFMQSLSAGPRMKPMIDRLEDFIKKARQITGRYYG